MFRKTKHIHFIGIGGIGMSGMAELLFKLGFKISGSDIEKSERIISLIKIGVDFFIGHNNSNIIGADVVVYSSAIRKNNPEIISALKKNIPLIRRAEMLAELLKLKSTSIAISGTHGKTTTCSILGNILTEANTNPTLVIGGIVNKFQSNTISGNGEIIVVEADEFDRSFLTLQPTMALITNLDLEHLDCYENLLDLQNAFLQFANAVPFYGKIAICADYNNTAEIIPDIKKPIITFGLNDTNEIKAKNLQFQQTHTIFDLVIKDKNLGSCHINVPGRHNVINALGAIALAHELEIPLNKIQDGLFKYSGVRRRFEIKYKLSNGIIIIDDYAHHPVEVFSTLEAAKSGWNQRIISVFQPHLFTRTRDFYQEFAQAFKDSDILIVTDIYEARELPIPGITAEIISDASKKMGHKHVEYIPDQTQIPNRLLEITKDNDIIITMGAGNIWRQCENIYKALVH